jgi:hypothetical protein
VTWRPSAIDGRRGGVCERDLDQDLELADRRRAVAAGTARSPPARIGAAVILAAALAVAAGPRAPRLPVSQFRCTTTRRRADPSPSENLSLLPVTSRLMPLMFFNPHDTNECGRVCSRMACRSWWPHLLNV